MQNLARLRMTNFKTKIKFSKMNTSLKLPGQIGIEKNKNINRKN